MTVEGRLYCQTSLTRPGDLGCPAGSIDSPASSERASHDFFRYLVKGCLDVLTNKALALGFPCRYNPDDRRSIRSGILNLSSLRLHYGTEFTHSCVEGRVPLLSPAKLFFRLLFTSFSFWSQFICVVVSSQLQSLTIRVSQAHNT